MIGVEDTIATTVNDYVAIATRLGKDAQFRRAISSRMAEKAQALSRPRACDGVGGFPGKSSARLIDRQGPLSCYIFTI
jgi:hypothetical protein